MKTRILIVEDDLESLKLIGLMLQRRGYEIIAANAGSQALRKIEAENPDLVILDVMMPEMDGYAVCQKLRANPQTAHLPVIMFTAKSLPEDRAAGYQAGADDYLTKPIHPSELVTRVEGLLQRSAQERASARALTRGRVIGVMGAKGGVGASTLSVNLAVAVGQLHSQAQEKSNRPSVSLIDLRCGLGTVALLLGKMPGGGWANIIEQSVRGLDQDLLQNQVLTHESGVRYIPAPLQPEKGQAFLPIDYVEHAVNHLATTSDFLFLDLGGVLDDSTRFAVGLCDTVLVVIEPEPLCIYMAQVLLEKIKELDPAPADVRAVVIERSDSQSVCSPEEIADVLGHDIAGAIKAAPVPLRQAAERGKPFVLSHPDSDIAVQFRELAQLLLA